MASYIIQEPSIAEQVGSVVGVIASAGFWIGAGIQYLRGKWPFYRIKDKNYHLLQWFWAQPGRVLEGAGTRLFLQPFEKEVEGAILPMRDQEQEMAPLKFNVEGLEGNTKIRYMWKFPDKKGAKKFYWRISKDVDMKTAMSKVDELVKNVVLEEMVMEVKEDGTKIKHGVDDFLEYGWLNRAKTRLLRNGVRYRDASENLYNRFGVQLIDLVSESVDFDENSRTTLAAPVRGKLRSEELIKIAQAEARATEIQAKATEDAMKRYRKMAADMLKKTGLSKTSRRKYELARTALAMRLAEMDNIQDAGRAGIKYYGGQAGAPDFIKEILPLLSEE